MKKSTSASVKKRVSEAPDYSFVRMKDFVGTPKAIEAGNGGTDYSVCAR
jgi:hypothetical protein